MGLAAPTISTLTLVLIMLLRWGPQDAQRPVTALLFLFAVAYVPAAVLAFWKLRGTDAERLAVRFRFRVATLLLATLLLALPMGLGRTFGGPGAAMGLLVSYCVFASMVTARFIHRRDAVGFD